MREDYSPDGNARDFLSDTPIHGGDHGFRTARQDAFVQATHGVVYPEALRSHGQHRVHSRPPAKASGGCSPSLTRTNCAAFSGTCWMKTNSCHPSGFVHCRSRRTSLCAGRHGAARRLRARRVADGCVPRKLQSARDLVPHELPDGGSAAASMAPFGSFHRTNASAIGFSSTSIFVETRARVTRQAEPRWSRN